ncbi:hypothetical protein EZV62_019799 [Acer yangbiense]|uniref:VQ domain-containing protein n=1 Tax=Acer yangbiense TaxID=1000413 RepID=A0A5C7HBR2_9ROSI|nr:hypothetical protein EZV62_019799 [Acer yangbiense]
MKRKAVSGVKEGGKNENCSKKQQLNHLIKVLRPKVYITDTSNFKSLVQQLTGNINATSSSSLSLPPSSQSSPLDRTEVVLHVEDDHHIHGGDDHQLPQQSNTNCSAEEANSSSFEASVDNDHSFDQLCDINVNMLSSLEAENGSRVQLNEISSSSSSMNEQYSSWDWLAYQEIESWLLDDVHVDHHRHNYQQEVSVYDYELFSWANMN